MDYSFFVGGRNLPTSVILKTTIFFVEGLTNNWHMTQQKTKIQQDYFILYF